MPRKLGSLPRQSRQNKAFDECLLLRFKSLILWARLPMVAVVVSAVLAFPARLNGNVVAKRKHGISKGNMKILSASLRGTDRLLQPLPTCERNAP